MEKLQPLLKHKFWIISGAALLLPLIGWWLNTGKVGAEIETRWQALAALSVPPGTGTANQSYIDGISAVNGVLDERQTKLAIRLYNEQKSLHTWPPYVSKFMVNKKYREPVDFNVRQLYMGYHRDEVQAMLTAIRQYTYREVLGKDGEIVPIESGVVVVDLMSVPHVDVDKEWGKTPPRNEQMWDTQEDVWLTDALLRAIDQVNAGSTKISDAPIREIISISLRGGSRASATPSVDGGADGAAMAETIVEDTSYTDAAAGVDGMGSGSEINLGNVTIDGNATFGSDSVQAAGGGENADAAVAMPGQLSTGGSGGPGKRRYVDDDPAMPYKTRGFILDVLMLHDKVPDLQAALVSMDWPTELLMIKQSAIHQDDVTEIVDPSTNGRTPGTRFRPQQGTNRGGGGFNTRQPRFGGGNRGGAGVRTFGGGNFGQQRFGGAGRGGNTFRGMDTENPMDMGTGRGPGRRTRGMPDESGSFEQQRSTYDIAMGDYYVARVAIAGLMTIYRSPEEMAAEGGTTDGQTTPPTTEQIPADPAAPITTPDGQPIPETGTTPEGQPIPETGTAPIQPAPTEPVPAEAVPMPEATQPAPTPPAEVTTPPNGEQPTPPAAPPVPKTPPAEQAAPPAVPKEEIPAAKEGT